MARLMGVHKSTVCRYFRWFLYPPQRHEITFTPGDRSITVFRDTAVSEAFRENRTGPLTGHRRSVRYDWGQQWVRLDYLLGTRKSVFQDWWVAAEEGFSEWEEVADLFRRDSRLEDLLRRLRG